jgi:hypothetical protein
MINLSVYTVSGKFQDFLVNIDKYIGDIKNQIQKNHRYLSIPINQEIKLLYKGIELDELKTLEFYGIKENTTIQIINKTKPIQINNSYNPDYTIPINSFGGGGGGRRLSESMPSMNIFEHYAPSPMETDIHKFSKSSSPNFSVIAEQGRDIMKQIRDISTTMENILERLDKLENRMNHIYESGIIPKK